MIRKGDFEHGDIILITKTHFEPNKYVRKIVKVHIENDYELGFRFLDGNGGCYLDYDDPRESAVLASEAIKIMWGIK